MNNCKSVFRRLLGALVLVTSVSQATTVIPPSFAELVAKADLVVDGEITAVRSELVHSGGGRLVYTYVTVEVLETIKGVSPENLELRLLGGTMGDFTMQVEGVPEFAVGDRDVLFVVGNGEQFCPLVAIMHGRYPVIPRPSDGEEIVLRTSGEPLADPADVERPLAHGSHMEFVTVAEAADQAMTVESFKSVIREEVRRGQNQ